jgi:hypothetical protein
VPHGTETFAFNSPAFGTIFPPDSRLNRLWLAAAEFFFLLYSGFAANRALFQCSKYATYSGRLN